MNGSRLLKLRARLHASAASGNMLVEYAFVMPALVFGCFFCIQCVYLSFQVAGFDFAVNSMLNDISADQVEQEAKPGGDLDELARQAVKQAGLLIDMDELSVSGMAASFPDEYDAKSLSAQDQADYSIKRVTQDRRYMELSGTVTYTVKLMFALPGLSTVKLEKSIEKTRLVESTFEVS